MSWTPEKWREIERLVDQALRRPGPERAAFVVAQCAGDEATLERVLDLLFATSEAEAIVTPMWVPAESSEATETWQASEPSETAGLASSSEPTGETFARTLGSFRILRQLGKGGMGTVYLAEQSSPVERQVAVKVAHSPLGSEGRLRIAAERQAMARLSHPNIAQVLEAGSTEDGYPYFAMELVDGAPITTYCDEREIGIETRIRLFQAVCSGVQHAHQKGILHRDLKPNNVLVTEIDGRPTPKIIDFGIAKALDRPLLDHTLETGERILGTPAYLSPEVLGAGATPDTRGDVYSLGVLLQELLIGERPFPRVAGETPASQWLRKVEEDPVSPSRRWSELDEGARDLSARRRGLGRRELGRKVQGDLDWIVLRAVARDPTDRYASVSELASDVERFLADEPVLAGPPTASYQLRKLIRRHRLPVAFSLLLLLALVAGFVARSLEAARANRQAVEALAAREETEKVVDYLVDLFDAADPDRALGREVSARELLEAGTSRLEGAGLEETPRVKARLLHTSAQVYRSLGDVQDALRLAEEALATRRRELGTDHPDFGASLLLVATLESEVGNYERSEELLGEALALRAAAHGESSLQVLSVLKVLGAIHEETGRYEEALAIYERARQTLSRLPVPAPVEEADVLNNMGVVYWRQDRYDEAEALYRRALELKKQHLETGHPSLAMTLNNLGDVLRLDYRLEEAGEMYRRALEIRERVLGEDHPHLGMTLFSIGNLERQLGRWDEAEALFERARTLWAQALGPEHDWVAHALHNLGLVYFSQGRDIEAEDLYRRALRIRRAAFDDSGPLVAESRLLLGKALRTQGRYDEAAQELEAAQEYFETSSDYEWFVAVCLAERGLVAFARGELDVAEELLHESRVMGEADDPPESRLGYALFGLARIARARGSDDEAKQLAQRALDCFATDLPPVHRHVEEARKLLED